ncbi:hypothetical protein KEM60_00426 [Austwickia sp. TVS 96-490-7B]|nr:hypothetical protein [Austwickia sp. TVS 96-490-7B]
MTSCRCRLHHLAGTGTMHTRSHRTASDQDCAERWTTTAFLTPKLTYWDTVRVTIVDDEGHRVTRSFPLAWSGPLTPRPAMTHADLTAADHRRNRRIPAHHRHRQQQLRRTRHYRADHHPRRAKPPRGKHPSQHRNPLLRAAPHLLRRHSHLHVSRITTDRTSWLHLRRDRHHPRHLALSAGDAS